MYVLRIEHSVHDYAVWKQAFDSQPVDREAGGVLHHRIFRPLDDPAFVMIDLDFSTSGEAESFLTQLQQLWTRVVGKLIESPKARIVEIAESADH